MDSENRNEIIVTDKILSKLGRISAYAQYCSMIMISLALLAISYTVYYVFYDLKPNRYVDNDWANDDFIDESVCTILIFILVIIFWGYSSLLSSSKKLEIAVVQKSALDNSLKDFRDSLRLRALMLVGGVVAFLGLVLFILLTLNLP